ncbi:DUF3862 domain-containing protein [Bacillus testis]|uniref:DUF3862 domain-containing protein n=1 Tax=Bacillus testis TaxID=1622072 RepID=UPI00067F331B|nr:DUF3862 domain-containing protein [Bacillus testis]
MKKLFKFGCLGLIAIILIIVIAAIAFGGGDDNSSDHNTKTEQTNTESSSKSSNKLTKEKFEQIKDGMSYEEVTKIVGSKGTVVSESGDQGSNLHTVIYEFDTDGFMSNATMTFQGGKLINKAQVGLGGDSGAEITLEQFNAIENGMSYEEVTKIIGGEGEVLSESGEKGTNLHTVIYVYQGKGNLGANANFTFQGNKLVNKAQFGLK